MPTLVTSYFAESFIDGDTTPLSTPSFTPNNGEVIVVKAATWDTGTPVGAPSGGALTYMQRATAAPGGFACYSTIYTSVVSGSPGAMTVTLGAPGASCYHSMVVERWSSAQLAGTPAVSSPASGKPASGAPLPSATVTTTGTNSIVTWVSADVNSLDPATRAYLSSATEDGLGDGHTHSSTVHYFAYQTAASAGSQTIGLSAPSGQNWVMCGIEIQDLAVASNSKTGNFLTFFS